MKVLTFPAQASTMIEHVAEALCAPAAHSTLSPVAGTTTPMPSLPDLEEIMSRLRAALFPGYYGETHLFDSSFRYHLTANLDSIFHKLAEQIHRGICFSCNYQEHACEQCIREAEEKSLAFLAELPAIRDLLSGDVQAAYEGDPAAKSPGETIFCYPSLAAMTNHRIAHVLYNLGVPLIPRIISEMAHSRTGIDIHPGAQIGEEFFIDHGTGVVIGETCIIGKRCRIYQGVTLGAISFAKDEAGVLVKGQPRHPILGDHVTVYAGATILGRVTIGSKSVIGGNVWLTHSVPDDSYIAQQRAPQGSGLDVTNT